MTCNHEQCKRHAAQIARAEEAGDRVLAEMLELEDAIEREEMAQ